MKINVAQIKEHQKYQIEEKLTFDKAAYAGSLIKDLQDVNAKITYEMDGEYLNIHFQISGSAILTCCYTLQDVPYTIRCSDDFTYTDNKDNETETISYFSKNTIELDDDILDIILASIPMRVVAKGAKLPKDGNGYRVLSEEQFIKEQEDKSDSPFDALSNLDLDD